MKCDKQFMCLYAVTDRAWTGRKTLYEQVEEALKGGVTCVQLREKDLPFEDFLNEAKKIHGLCQKYGIPLFINDNVEIALAVGAEGIHVGQEDMEAAEVRRFVGEDMMIGVSVHTVEEAERAVAHGADCLGLGTIFPTSTKTDVEVMPLETIRAITAAVDVPIVAIGGIKKSNLMYLAGSGVDGIAVVSAIFGAEDIETECRELRRLSEEMIRL